MLVTLRRATALRQMDLRRQTPQPARVRERADVRTPGPPSAAACGSRGPQWTHTDPQRNRSTSIQICIDRGSRSAPYSYRVQIFREGPRAATGIPNRLVAINGHRIFKRTIQIWSMQPAGLQHLRPLHGRAPAATSPSSSSPGIVP